MGELWNVAFLCGLWTVNDFGNFAVCWLDLLMNRVGSSSRKELPGGTVEFNERIIEFEPLLQVIQGWADVFGYAITQTIGSMSIIHGKDELSNSKRVCKESRSRRRCGRRSWQRR